MPKTKLMARLWQDKHSARPGTRQVRWSLPWLPAAAGQRGFKQQVPPHGVDEQCVFLCVIPEIGVGGPFTLLTG
ncbi:MAG: hypothetical protein R3C09_05660 [Pirellulaceae bacterium]